MSSVSSFDATIYRLGSLCKRGHAWGETDASLRYRCSNNCVACLQERLARPTWLTEGAMCSLSALCSRGNPAAIAARFWAKVDKSAGPEACWLWTGTIAGRRQYGQFHVSPGVRLPAHRMAYLLAHDVIPLGLLVRHTCDNRRCVAPHHLQAGSHDDNMADMVARSRQARGERQGIVRLSAKDVREIRAARAEQGLFLSVLAAQYGVSLQTIWSVVRGQTWKHI